jgi:hypothetical protein
VLIDRYDLGLSTASAAARDAYVEACDLALTFYPGAAEAYDRAIGVDPGFALALAGKDVSTSLTARLRASGSICFSPPILTRPRLRLSTVATGR